MQRRNRIEQTIATLALKINGEFTCAGLEKLVNITLQWQKAKKKCLFLQLLLTTALEGAEYHKFTCHIYNGCYGLLSRFNFECHFTLQATGFT